jgi:hypothetical protein
MFLVRDAVIEEIDARDARDACHGTVLQDCA